MCPSICHMINVKCQLLDLTSTFAFLALVLYQMLYHKDLNVQSTLSFGVFSHTIPCDPRGHLTGLLPLYSCHLWHMICVPVCIPGCSVW